jgi:hypothetical protein
MDDGVFDPDADIISGTTSPGLDEELQNSDDSLAADLIAELDDLDLDIGNTFKLVHDVSKFSLKLTDRSKKKRKGTRLAPAATQHEGLAETSQEAENAPAVQSLPTTPAEDDDAPSEISKRDKRRAKEAKKKAAEEAEHLARKEARKAGRKAQAAPDTLAEQNDKLRKDDGRSRNDEDFTTPRTKKGKGKQIRSQQLPDEFGEEKVARAVLAIKTNREKMLDKWGEKWSGESKSPLPADS